MTIIIFIVLLLLFVAMTIAPLIADLPQKKGSIAKSLALSKHPSAQRQAASATYSK